MKQFAIILSGCGGMDGSETHEATCLMLAIKQNKCNYRCFAINENQKYVVHTNGMSQSNEKRNMLIEAGRLDRGLTKDLKKLDVNKFDALIFPGGYGTGTSFSDFIECDGKTCKKNSNYKVRAEIKNIIQEFHAQNKPIFAGCMASILPNGSLKGAKIMTDTGKYTEEAIIKNNNKPVICKAGEICIDEENKVITAPYYLSSKIDIDTIYKESMLGIQAVVKLCKE